MATAKSNIVLGGRKIDPYHVSIQQKSDWHHSFEIAVSSEKIEGKNSLSIDQSITYVGQSTEISIQCAGNELRFKGIITTVHLDRTYTGDSLVIFSGYSPTYLLEDGVGTKSYEEKDIAGIVNEIFRAYPSNLLNPVVSPQYSTPIPYIVRYKETNYQFLSRIAATYGEWFYYDGQSVIFGALPNAANIDLTLGKDLDSFDYGVNLRPSNFKYQFYKYEENRTLENTTTGFKPGWLDNYGKKAHDAAAGIFPSEPINPVWHDAKEDALIKHLAEAQKSSLLSDTTFFRGQSQNPGIMVGGRIGANAMNKVGTQNVPTFIGRFRVTAVTHQLNANKDYSNQFTAIPVAVIAPAVNTNVYKPEAESQVAVVKENNDPDQLGRIRVQFKWQTGEEMTPWIRQSTNHASGDRGIYFVPEIGDEVYIDFEQGNPDRPYMTGAKYHSNTKPEFFDPDNNLKSIKTRSGHTILLNDQAGGETITIKDRNGNQILIDTEGNNMTITALETMTLNAKNLMINVGENMTTSVGENMTASVGKNITENAGENIAASAGQNISQKAGANIDVNAQSSVSVSASSNASFKASKTASIAGKNIKVNGGSTIRIKSSDTDVL